MRDTALEAHQCPGTQQHEIVPEHVPVFSGGLPVACSVGRGMRLERYAGFGKLLPERVDRQSDAALSPGKAWVEDEIDETGERGGHHTALESIDALPYAAQRRILIDRKRRVGPT